MRRSVVAMVALLLVAATLVLYFTRSGRVSGDIFVTMRSGDVKRGADVQVSLIPRTPEFESGVTAIAEEMAPEYTAARSEHQRWNAELKLPREEWRRDQASKAELDAFVRLTSLEASWRSRIVELATSASVATVRADVSGHFSLDGVKAGRYYIFARYTVFDSTADWFVPITISSGGETKVALSNSNSGLPFFK